MLGLALPIIARRRIGGAPPPPPPPSAWAPSDLGTLLAAWWDADDAATIVLASGVSQWSDKSGNGRHLLQATGTLQPARTAAALNGRAGLTFAQKYLACVAASAPLATQMMLVIVASNDVASTNNRGLMVLYPAGATNDYASPSAIVAMEQMANGAYQTYANSLVGASSGAGVSGAAGKILAVEKDGANATFFRLNGATSPTSGAVFAGNALATATAMLVGCRNVSGANPASYGYAGTIHEIILANAVPVLADRQKLEGYLAARWGLQALLPAGHPYKAAAP